MYISYVFEIYCWPIKSGLIAKMETKFSRTWGQIIWMKPNSEFKKLPHFSFTIVGLRVRNNLKCSVNFENLTTAEHLYRLSRFSGKWSTSWRITQVQGWLDWFTAYKKPTLNNAPRLNFIDWFMDYIYGIVKRKKKKKRSKGYGKILFFQIPINTTEPSKINVNFWIAWDLAHYLRNNENLIFDVLPSKKRVNVRKKERQVSTSVPIRNEYHAPRIWSLSTNLRLEMATNLNAWPFQNL